jgi:hypothetical protein
MATAKRRVVPLALAISALGLVVLTQVASASHPRPKGASPIRVPLVVAFNSCPAPNRTHGPSLAFPSCNPPGQTSNYVTVGTPDANGAAANSVGFVKLTAIADVPGPPEGSDLVLKAQITDVRCKPGGGTFACGSANAADGPDYTGELQFNPTVRLTDHFNAVSPGGGADPATVIDIPFPVNIPCSATIDTSVGALCSIDTTFEAVKPGSITRMEGKRAVIELNQIEVIDGGSDGSLGTLPNTLFADQGIFIP